MKMVKMWIKVTVNDCNILSNILSYIYFIFIDLPLRNITHITHIIVYKLLLDIFRHIIVY